MLDESDGSDRLMKAEIMRELGRFGDAKSILSGSFDDRLSQALSIIKGLTDAEDPYVREMHFE